MLTKTPGSSNAWQKRNYYDLAFWFEIITIKAKTKISFSLQVPEVPQREEARNKSPTVLSESAQREEPGGGGREG